MAVTPGSASAGIAEGDAFGAIDSVTGGGGEITVNGWISDPDGPTTQGSIFINGSGTVFTTWVDRPDVRAAHPRSAAKPGFRMSFTVAPGTHTVCVTAVNVGRGAANPSIGCRTVTVTDPNSPIGRLDTLTPHKIGDPELFGWAWDRNTTAPIEVHAYIGSRGWRLEVGEPRRDVPNSVPGAHPFTGFWGVLEGAPTGRQTVCVAAINVGAGSNTWLECREIVIPEPSPFGVVDVIETAPGGALRFSGWAVDRDNWGDTEIHVYVGSDGINDGMTSERRLDVGPAVGLGLVDETWGFDSWWTGPWVGTKQVCVYAINASWYTPLRGGNTLLGCRTVTFP